MLRLNPEWSSLLSAYKAQHANPMNQACHRVGIPLIIASLPVGATIIGLPLAAGMFTTGWAFQFAGHYLFEGNDPAFFGDRRNLLVGAIWTLEKFGVQIEVETPAS
jgi:uncharacterized membrane protein YGL010W